MKVFVYFNLHKKCFSVKAMEGERKGRVIAHCTSIDLYNVQFKVSEAGRQRVLREKRKNVHAGVVGHTFGATNVRADHLIPVTYNPYKYDSFVERATEQPVHRADFARLDGRSILALI